MADRPEDRRSTARVNLRSQVWLGRDGVFTQSVERLTNLGRQGAFVETPHGHAVHSVLNMRFSLGADLVSATVIVRYVQPHGMGVEFLDLPQEDRDRIATFISRELQHRD
jgi:hypothetical protein